MRLPALWLAAAFAAGIGLAARLPGEASAGIAFPFALSVAFVLAAILLGGLLAWRRQILAAWICALVAWFALGGLAAGIERASVSANHAARLIATGKLDTSAALRYRGRLREDPLALPWGHRFEIDLEQVEVAGQSVAINGGLRANLYNEPRDPSSTGGAWLAFRAGDRVEALLRVRPPRNFMDPGAFDLQGYLANQGIDLIGTLRSGDLLALVDRPSPTLRQRLARVRGTLLVRIDSLFADHPERAAVLRAMLLGDRSFVDSQVVLAFQKTAVYHVLVVAGLHVGALAAFLFWLCRRLRLSIAVTSFATLIALAAYVGVVQDRPPIFRAALIAAFYLLARPLFRRIELLQVIAIAALVILFWKPSSLFDSSFELSFLAAGVIAGLALPWIERTSAPYRAGLSHLGDVTRDSAHPPKVAQFRLELRAAANRFARRLPATLAPRANVILSAPVRLGLRLWEIVLLSAVIQWGMMPMLARDFHRVSLAGPLSNIPSVLLTGLIVPLGFLTLAASFASLRIAAVLAHPLTALVSWLLGVVDWFSRWPRVSYRIPGPPVWLMVAFFAAFVFVAAAARTALFANSGRNARRRMPPPIRATEWISALALAALTILIATYPFAPRLEARKLAVTVLDVGQGDSIFASFPGGHTMLIDGGGLAGSEWARGYRTGPDVGEEVVSPYLWSRGLKRLDVVALTHAHHDHLDGLHAVIQNFRVGELWIGRDEETPAFKALLEEARVRGARVVHRVAGEQFQFDGVTGEVLWPPDSAEVAEASNDDSLVLRLADGGVHFLLTGDIQAPVEDKLAADRAPLAAEFLKVPHHGSKTSSTPAFLAAVTPRVAAVSVGEGNQFGQPVQSVVERYAQAGVRFLRTDHDGAVTAVTDGQSLEVHTFAEIHPH